MRQNLIFAVGLTACGSPSSESKPEVQPANAEDRRAASPKKAASAPLAVDAYEFGEPAVKPAQYGITKVLVEVTNTQDRPLNCMVAATFKKGTALLGVADTYVEVHPGKPTTATLETMDDVSGYESVEVGVPSCLQNWKPRAASPKKAASAPLAVDAYEFGEPAVKPAQYGITKVLVEVTNTQDRPLNCMVAATFKKGTALLGVADTYVEVHPGKPTTATLKTMDDVSGYESVEVGVPSCLQNWKPR